MLTPRISAFAGDSRGSSAILYGVASMGAAMAVAAAVVYVNLTEVRARHQQSLDAAVLAGVLASDRLTEAQRVDVATRTYLANARTAAADSTTSFWIEIDQPNFTAQGTRVSGAAAISVRNPFPLMGGEQLTVHARATAVRSRSTPICVLGLNDTEAGAFNQNGHAVFEATNCAAQFNSRNGAAMLQQGAPVARAAAFGVSGAAQGGGYDPPPLPGSASVRDPYASLPFPMVGPCVDASSRLNGDTVTLDPGTYCGGLEARAGSTVTLNPGVYVMKDGNFTVQSGSRVTGQNVTIAFIGEAGNWPATLMLLGGATMHVTSPQVGPYAGVQFYGARETYRNPGWPSIGGSGNAAATLTYDGVMYFPTQAVWIYGGTTVTARSPTLAVISQQLWLQDHARLTVIQDNSRNISGLAPGPSIETGAKLVR